MVEKLNEFGHYASAISESGLSIYDPIGVGHPTLWIPTPALEHILNEKLTGTSLAGLPLRTRSKVAKEYICQALGYPTPKSFKKTQPRFPGQLFDTYIQKSNNLQVWNEELEAIRRYVIVRLNSSDIITSVKVVTGGTLARLDTTGTLTQKYQARFVPSSKTTELTTENDTVLLQILVDRNADFSTATSPINHPVAQQLLPINIVFEKLSALIGTTFTDAGHDQERNRGANLHKLVCQSLGYKSYEDDGRFPDIRHQLIEVKLQTSPTIDLGLVCPNSTDPLETPKIKGHQIRHCDVRYALFYARIENESVTITNLCLTTGEHFFNRFQQFQGKVLNKKLQIPLPVDFFNR